MYVLARVLRTFNLYHNIMLLKACDVDVDVDDDVIGIWLTDWLKFQLQVWSNSNVLQFIWSSSVIEFAAAKPISNLRNRNNFKNKEENKKGQHWSYRHIKP